MLTDYSLGFGAPEKQSGFVVRVPYCVSFDFPVILFNLQN